MASSEIPLVGPMIQKIFGTRNERIVKRYHQRAEAINAMSDQMSRLTDAQIREKTTELRDRVRKGTKVVDVLEEALAVAREAMDRNVGIRNIFNPLHADRFDPSRLSDSARRLYDETKA
ncbi:MAG: hypothetical protein AAFX05_10530, partial [Planctomycetota bacterium]